MMTIKVCISRDFSSQSVGADEIALLVTEEARRRNIPIEITRTGSYGLYWLEPIVEVRQDNKRAAYSSIGPSDIRYLFDEEFYMQKPNEKFIGDIREVPYLKNQERLTFSRVGEIDPLSMEEYRQLGGLTGLEVAIRMKDREIVDHMIQSGLRGRGGAAFPTGIKWQTVLNTPAEQKYIVCNADEGDSGTFSDRMIMESDPFSLIEGMIIAGIGVGATKGYIYLRAEYPFTETVLSEALKIARDEKLLGSNILNSKYNFDIELRRAAGAYICGEETALLESLEGKRGVIRFKPPLPAIQGLFGKPTIINNVITLATVPIIFERGADYYANYGMGRSRGTLPFQLAGNVRHGGLVEKAFGLTLRELLYEYGGGSASGRPIRAVQVGGPLGAYIPEHHFDTPLGYEELGTIDAMLGHGGVVVFDETVDMAEQACYAMEFCAIESCGKCTPCRIGSTRGAEVIDRIIGNMDREKNMHLLRELCDTMLNASLCALGGMTPFPVLSALKHFPEDFKKADALKKCAS